MKKIKRWRYYCDHCKKSGGSGWHMKNHEEICTNNPERKCGLCRMAEQEQPKTQGMIYLMNKYIETVSYNEFGHDEVYNEFVENIAAEDVLKELRRLTGNCPACILTAMRLTKTTSLFLADDFDFKEEKKEFFNTYKNVDFDYPYY